MDEPALTSFDPAVVSAVVDMRHSARGATENDRVTGMACRNPAEIRFPFGRTAGPSAVPSSVGWPR